MTKVSLLYHPIGALLLSVALSGSGAFAQEASGTLTKPVTSAMFVPERQESLVWENDLVAFRTFGRSLSPGTTKSGIECWFKRNPAPVASKWYASEDLGLSRTRDEGDGYSPYEVGASRGCGGNGIWKNDKLYVADTFSGWKMISQTAGQTVFELTYDYDVEGDKIHEDKRITLEEGKRFFKSQSTFTRDGKPAMIDIGIGLTNEGGRALCGGDEQWIYCWQTVDGRGLGTGIVVDKQKFLQRYAYVGRSNPNVSNSIIIASTDQNGQISWYAGYAWTENSDIKRVENWIDYMGKFANSLK